MKQGSMSVREYEAKFTELARYAKNQVLDEATKCLRLEEGLSLYVKRGVQPFQIRDSYQQIVAKALTVEEGDKEFLEARNRSKSGPVRNKPQHKSHTPYQKNQ